jgi:hypothetical protein
VLAANPNAVFSTVYANLAANTFAIPIEENNCKTAMEYIRQLVSIGDAASARYVFGFYEDRVAYYNAIPTTPEYQYQLSSGSQAVEMYADNSTVYPWDVRPAKWIFITDFLIGRVSSTTAIRDDPRMMFIESLNFTAPFSLQLQGAKVSTLPQRLAQLGLGGMS